MLNGRGINLKTIPKFHPLDIWFVLQHCNRFCSFLQISHECNLSFQLLRFFVFSIVHFQRCSETVRCYETRNCGFTNSAIATLEFHCSLRCFTIDGMITGSFSGHKCSAGLAVPRGCTRSDNQFVEYRGNDNNQDDHEISTKCR
jgi:hypothetical protein